MIEIDVENLTEVRETLIFGALREADSYLRAHKCPIDRDLVRMVVVDEALTRWYGRDLFAPVTAAATEALHYVEQRDIESLLRERGYLV
jgi:hypothetical protein